jgi:hypothetical protein
LILSSSSFFTTSAGSTGSYPVIVLSCHDQMGRLPYFAKT